MSDAKVTRDPSLYRKLSEPFESPEEANEALDKFYAAVRAARVECGIPDVHIITQVNVIYPHGESTASSVLHLGSSVNALPLAAIAYGVEKKTHEGFVAQLLRDAAIEVPTT